MATPVATTTANPLARMLEPVAVEPSEASMQEFKWRVHNLLFTNADDQHDFLAFVAGGIAGEIQYKKWALFVGFQDDQVEILKTTMQSTFGDLFMSLDASALTICDEEQEEEEDALAHHRSRQRMALHGKRLVMAKAAAGTVVDGIMIKSVFCSGGDPILAEDDDGNDQAFVPRARLMLFVPEVPEIKPRDAAYGMVMFVSDACNKARYR